MQKAQFILTICCLALLCTTACQKEDPTPPEIEPPITEEPPEEDDGLKYLEPSPQRPGDPEAGYEYLLYGDYVNGGFPYELYLQTVGASTSNHLDREGDNANVDFTHSVITSNGVKVVTSNCLQCHGTKLNGEFIMGLGNTTFDYTKDLTDNIALSDAVIIGVHGENSPEWNAYEPFRRGYLAVAPYIKTEVRGVNSADKLATII